MQKNLERIEDCLPLLLSGDWKKRLVGEYWEMKIRSAALKEYIERRTEEEHGWSETMEHHMMSRQLSDMLGYLSCLGLRATEKEIDLMDTEIPESEYFILLTGNDEMKQVQINGFSRMCMQASMDAAAKIAVRAKKEEVPMKKFIEDSAIAFARSLCKIAEGENGCK